MLGQNMNLDCLDFLGISSLLSDEEIMVQKTTKNFAQNEIAPIIEDCFEKSEFPAKIIKKIGSLGLLGANLPVEYGCSGMSHIAYGLICQELERVDSGIRSF
jgi:glutaryl-CoA dehydrogenase